jgi:rod shape-determining protein MreD
MVITLIPLQVNLLPALLPERWIPHLGIVVVVLCGLRYGEGVGVVSGLLLGLLYDRFTAGQVGMHIFMLPCMGVAVALFWRLISVKRFGTELVLLCTFSLGGELASAMLFHIAGSIRLDAWEVWQRLLPGVLADVIFGIILLRLTALRPQRYSVR